MKKSLSCLFLCASIFVAQQALADIPTMNLSWTLSDTSGISQYKLYYASTSDMSAKTWHQECGSVAEAPTGTFSMTCTNIPINTFPAYIQIAAQLTDGSETFSNTQGIAEDPSGTPPAGLSKVQGFMFGVPSQATPPPQPEGTVFYWSMNTLPTTTAMSDFGNVTITKHQDDATSIPAVNGNGMQQTGTWQTYRFPMSIVPTAKGTISFWAKHDTPPDSNDGTTRYFFRSTNDSQANTVYAYTYKNNTYFYIYDSSGSLHRTYKVADTWSAGVWYQYEFSWDESTGSMVIKRDGSIVSELSTDPWSTTSPTWGSQDLYIGYSNPMGNFDEFYILNN